MNTPLRRSGMARVFKGSHSFTCTPRVHPLTEWTTPAFAFPAEAGTHLPTPEGWKAEFKFSSSSRDLDVRQSSCLRGLSGYPAQSGRWGGRSWCRTRCSSHVHVSFYPALVVTPNAASAATNIKSTVSQHGSRLHYTLKSSWTTLKALAISVRASH